MKKILLGLMLVAGMAMTQKADAQTRFSVHLNFGTPGYYAPDYGYSGYRYNTYSYEPVYRVQRVHYYRPYYRTYRSYPRYERVVYTYGRHRAYRRVCR